MVGFDEVFDGEGADIVSAVVFGAGGPITLCTVVAMVSHICNPPPKLIRVDLASVLCERSDRFLPDGEK